MVAAINRYRTERTFASTQIRALEKSRSKTVIRCFEIFEASIDKLSQLLTKKDISKIIQNVRFAKKYRDLNRRFIIKLCIKKIKFKSSRAKISNLGVL